MAHGYRATEIAWDAAVGCSADRLVLLALAKWADDDLSCFPSQDAIVQITRLNRKTVIAALKRLVDAGLVVLEKRALQCSNVYHIVNRVSTSTKNGSTEIGSTKNGSTENGTQVVPNLGLP